MSDVLDLEGSLPMGRLVVEASAGTGKTYSLSALVVRHVAERGIPASSLLVVTFTRAAAAELRDRTRAALVQAADAIAAVQAPPDQPWMTVLFEPADQRDERERHLRDAIATFDDATVTTIHGFCQQALRQLGLRAGTGLDAELGDSTAQLIDEVCRDLVVTELIDLPTALQWPSRDEVGPKKVLADLQQAVKALLGNPGAVAVPQPGTGKPKKNDTPGRLERWVELVHAAAAEVGVRRRARQELGYDDLITGLRDAVLNPEVAASLNDRYELVLVDEFQDTDPVQWQIFETAFTRNLVTVGDPKQAIYRFRGADVQAYLAATEGAPTVHLAKNFRSDADLVRATNALIDDVHLGDQRIVGAAVAAASDKVGVLHPGAALEIRTVPNHEMFKNSKGFSAPLGRRTVVADLVHQVVELLTVHRIGEGAEARRVRPGDIAVLVPSHSGATQVVRALDQARVPSVRTRTGSVLDTPAATQWALLLAAMERPAHAPTVRAAGLSAFLHSSAADLDPLQDGADVRIADLQRQCAEWADLLSSKPFLAWYDRVRADSSLVVTLLAAQGGERHLTDIDHIAELLATELSGNGTTAATALRTLERLRSEAEQGGELEAQMRRIDSDAQAVQITTLHGSKGLEYPVVLLPLSWQTTNARGTTIYNDHHTGVRMVDIATGQGWDGPDEHSWEKGRKHYAAEGDRGDRLRLLYVGLTRAEHRTIMWWAPALEATKSAVNLVLWDRDADGNPLHTEPALWLGPKGGFKNSMADVPNPADADVPGLLDALSQRAGGAIGHSVVPLEPPRVRWIPDTDDEDVPELMVADHQGRVVADRSWRRWSFTSITKTRDHVWVPNPVIAGGLDEPLDDPDNTANTDDATATSGPSVGMPLADVLAGAAFGTLVHSVLERIDPASPELDDALLAEVRQQLQRDRLDVDASVLVDGLSAALRTTLGPLADGLRLVDIPASDRLAELEFDMPLGAVQPRVTAAQVGEVLLATLPADDPQRPYAQQLADGRFEVDLGGFLQGSIDAVLRVPDAQCGHRYIVVDYKTNRLHQRGAADPMAAYHPSLLPEAMAHSDYPLQSILYSVALHRYLRWRLPGYQPEQHLGGIAYLFVRGMVGAGTPLVDGAPHGVFAWRPPAATVVALDQLLAGGGL